MSQHCYINFACKLIQCYDCVNIEYIGSIARTFVHSLHNLYDGKTDDVTHGRDKCSDVAITGTLDHGY